MTDAQPAQLAETAEGGSRSTPSRYRDSDMPRSPRHRVAPNLANNQELEGETE
jgi:hypothetical protein